MSDRLTTAEGRQIAYDRIEGSAPGVVFLGGLKSDRQGTKALALDAWARRTGRAYLRFDYSGHGGSSGTFEEGCVGDWLADSRFVIGALTCGPQILVGSSLGGWIALLLARTQPERIAALVTIAAAPDFTENDIWAGLTSKQRSELMRLGSITLAHQPSDSLIVTRRLIEDGRDNLVLRDPLKFSHPVRLLQGTEDSEVPVATALELLEHIDGPDVRLVLVKGADHRFSSPECLHLVETTIETLGLVS